MRTIRNGFGESIPDVTLASEQLVSRISNWQVLEEETGSDHQYGFTVLDRVGGPRATRQLPRWNIHRLNTDRLIEELRIPQGTDENDLSGRERAESQVSRVTSVIVRACDASMPRFGNGNRHQPAYCWTEEIAELRRTCLRLRAQRAQERRGATLLNAEFKQAQKRLRLAIKSSKRRCWKEICEEVNAVPWGLCYGARPLVLVATLDIKNAFNSARWIDLLAALRDFGVPPYIMRVAEDYFRDREVIIETS